MVNGQKGILQVKEGDPIRVISLKNIQSIFIISNPDKMNHIPVPERMDHKSYSIAAAW